MQAGFYTNTSELKFIDKLKHNIDTCQAFYFSVSFIKKPGLRLLAPNIEAALARGAKGYLITSTYQNFTDIDSLNWFHNLMVRYYGNFDCHLDMECFYDINGNKVGFHSKGYLFEFENNRELLVGSSNITVYALLKNVEWDISFLDELDNDTYALAKEEFNFLWEHTKPLTKELINQYKTHLYYSIERWDMDYEVANSEIKPNYMQRRALKELNRFRAMGATRALITASAGSGKTYLAAFDALNFNPNRLLYIAHEGSILKKSNETFQRIFGNDKTYGEFTGEYKESDADFVFSTNITMMNSLELFPKDHWDYIIIDECHHAVAESYRKIIEYFEPQFLLGITATPERMDRGDVLSLFDQNMPYELRLRDAIINGLVVPFKYYGIRDDLISYGINETKGHRFVEQFSDDNHCEFIAKMIESHRLPGQKLKALAFCRDVTHARRMAQAMEDYYHTCVLIGKNSVGERIRAYKDLQDDSSELEILFTVDILNEGVDIPAVNMVLFLRPTDSQTIFIQQLGRGLRNYEGKKFVTVLDFIGNDYKRSVQIAFALGSLAENFVVEKNLVANLIRNDYKSLGLVDYGVEIHLDDLSKKEILSYIDEVNFNTKVYLQQDYKNFKNFICAAGYPQHVDYLNNDNAPDLIKFMQSRIDNRKNASYYGFLKAINEENIPAFDERQEAFIRYVSEMLPIVRPYEYLILQYLINNAGEAKLWEIESYVRDHTWYSKQMFEHAIFYMLKSGFFACNDKTFTFNSLTLDIDLSEYLSDLLTYGLGKFDVDFNRQNKEHIFSLWSKYRKDQVQQLLLNNPKNNMKGTYIYNGFVYIYVTVLKANSTKEDLKYADGYIDQNTFQWESEAHINGNFLSDIKNSKGAHIFVRKVANEDGIQLPFTYIGTGHMEYIEGSKKANGAHLFRISMDNSATEEIYFDFKLPG